MNMEVQWLSTRTGDSKEYLLDSHAEDYLNWCLAIKMLDEKQNKKEDD